MKPFTRDLIKVRVKNMATERVCKEEELSESSFDIDGMKEQIELMFEDESEEFEEAGRQMNTDEFILEERQSEVVAPLRNQTKIKPMKETR
jgi:hypothetical protein